MRGPALLLLLALGGCAPRPLGYLEGAAGPTSRPLQAIAWGLTSICLLCTLGFLILLLYAVARGRRSASRDGDAIGRDFGGLPWIYWGIGLSFPALIVMAVWTLVTTRAVAEQPSRAPFTVEVTGHRWWWEVHYATGSPAADLTTANEIVIPTGVPIRLKLGSDDVIHSFWVPKLAGKMDMIPGHWNTTWFQADVPGTYRGECAEFCGLEHAKMAFTVRALAPAGFRRWAAYSLAPKHPGASVGRDLFETRCAACHSVRGTEAGGILGPDLTHVASRATIAAGMLPTSPASFDLWLADTQGVKPGALMPQIPLSAADRGAIVRYLGELH